MTKLPPKPSLIATRLPPTPYNCYHGKGNLTDTPTPETVRLALHWQKYHPFLRQEHHPSNRRR